MRPSLATERESQILDALEACVREVGIGGLTTQLIAEKSGLSRSHIRHYLGNKADQLKALVMLYTERYASSLERLVDTAESEDRREVVIRELFGDTWQDLGQDDDLVLDALNAYAASSPDAPSLAPMYDRIGEVVARTLHEAGSSPAEARTQAQLMVAFAFGVSSMHRLGLIDQQAALRHARRLMLLED